ncbi:MAG TPA: hypothetical protein DIU15_20755, partial [Deltaproteobacteria bacterium]|nr:hypothetical protein [Deltaproteobacteria bacterium]
LPAELVEGMVAEITALEQEHPEPVIVYPATRERPLLWTLVVLCLLMVVAVAFWGRERMHAQRLVEADRDMANMQTDRVLEDYRRLPQLVDDLTNPRVSVVHLAQESPAQGGGHARVFVNWEQRRITVRAVGLEPPPEERLYTMWWRGLGSEQLIGQLPATAVARGASVQLDIPEGLERSAQLLISVEAQGPVAPESRLGPVVLQGAIEPSEAEAEGEQSHSPAP